MRALFASPWRMVPVAVALPETVAVRVVAGEEYELRTDAEVVDEDTGAVTYPLVFVVDGGEVLEMPAFGMAPFHKLQPVTIMPTTHEIVVGSAVACNVWVLQRATPQHREVMPGGAGCGCKKCLKKHDHDDDEAEA